jgi:hypothetical protein
LKVGVLVGTIAAAFGLFIREYEAKAPLGRSSDRSQADSEPVTSLRATARHRRSSLAQFALGKSLWRQQLGAI